MSAWDGLNRRKFPRVNYPCQIVVRNEENEKNILLTHTENIGIGGICLILKKNIKMFSTVDLELDLMDFEDHIRCQGKVVWSIRRRSDEEKKPSFYDIGIEFVDISDKDKQRLDRSIDKLVKQGKVV